MNSEEPSINLDYLLNEEMWYVISLLKDKHSSNIRPDNDESIQEERLIRKGLTFIHMRKKL